MTEIITTAEELDALPIRSIAIDEDGDAYQKYSDGWRAAFCDPDPEEAFDLPERLALVHRPGQPAPSLPPTMEQIEDLLVRCRSSVSGELVIPTAAIHIHALYPTCQPSRDAARRAIFSKAPDYWDEIDIGTAADAVLALLPGRSEAEVKAEALREAADAADREKVDSLLPGVIGLSWLRDRADRLAGGEGRD